MRIILVVGTGKIGSTIAGLLSATGDYCVTVADRSAAQLDRLEADDRVGHLALDATDQAALCQAMAGNFAVLVTAPVPPRRPHRRGCAGGGHALSRPD